MAGKKGVPHPWLRKRPYEGCYNRFKDLATRKGRVVEITYEDFLAIVVKGKCEYCGIPLQWAIHNARDKGVHRPYQIDRVDNSLEYVKGNCVPCCPVCNKAKHALPLAEFVHWIARLYHNLKEKNIVT